MGSDSSYTDCSNPSKRLRGRAYIKSVRQTSLASLPERDWNRTQSGTTNPRLLLILTLALLPLEHLPDDPLGTMAGLLATKLDQRAIRRPPRGWRSPSRQSWGGSRACPWCTRQRPAALEHGRAEEERLVFGEYVEGELDGCSIRVGVRDSRRASGETVVDDEMVGESKRSTSIHPRIHHGETQQRSSRGCEICVDCISRYRNDHSSHNDTASGR